MDFYLKVKELYARGHYEQALAYLKNHKFDEPFKKDLKEFYFFALLLTISLKDIQSFKKFFYQMKEHALEQYGEIGWIKYLNQMLTKSEFPEFFVREELISIYCKVGLIKELRKESQNKIDRSIRKRRTNINLDNCQEILGAYVEVYQTLHDIYKGNYSTVISILNKLRNQLNSEKFDKVVKFIAANINPGECIRIEFKEVIEEHLKKKGALDVSHYRREEINLFERSILRNFINLIIIDFENNNHIINIIEFVLKTKNNALLEDLFTIAEGSPGIKDNDRFRSLHQYYKTKYLEKPLAINEEKKSDKCQRDTDVLWQSYAYYEQERDHDKLQEATVRGFLNVQKEEWLIERFQTLVVGLIELGFYRAVQDLIEKIKSAHHEARRRPEVNYFEAEVFIRLKDYISAIRTCHNVLSQKNITVLDEICFEYLLGESYFLIGEKDKAYRSFNKVCSVAPSYRLVQERLKIIEED